MKAAQDGYDRSACAASSMNYADFFSVLMYYGHMSKYDIMHSSRAFLYSIYQKYADRACENLGIANENNKDENGNTITLTEEDYPDYLRTNKAVQEDNDGLTDEDFLKKFPQYTNPMG